MKIDFNYEIDFKLNSENEFSDWINRILVSERHKGDTLSYVFCDDEYLGDINFQFLNHDTFTDIITFDYSDGGIMAGDIFISIERVRENAIKYKVTEDEELKRVMAHGVLHLMGYNDKTEEEKRIMRMKEDEMIKLFHVEH